MTREEVIKYLSRIGKSARPSGYKEALGMAVDALRAQQEPNDLLTLEELREMDGEPVYLDFGGCHGEYALVRVIQGNTSLRHKNGILSPVDFAFQCGGQVYRRKPEEG